MTVGLSHRFLHAINMIQLHKRPTVFPNPPFALFSTRVVLPSRVMKPAYILISSTGEIHETFPSLVKTPSEWRKNVVDVSPLVIMPGLIDPHVHINAPGRENWEGFDHATRAAAAGGTTTVLDMPLNNVPSTINAEALKRKTEAFRTSNPVIDVGFIGGIVPGNKESISELVDEGVLAFKSFMVDSQSADFPHVTEEDLKAAIHELNSIFSKPSYVGKPIPYILHAELDDFKPNTGSRASQLDSYDHQSYDHFERSRPHSWETGAIDIASKLVNNTNIHIHIAHVSSHEAAEHILELKNSRSFKAKITAETCPQYLLWAKESIPPGSTLLKCAPPIRSVTNREKLRSYLFSPRSGNFALDFVASDHSPCPPEMKETNLNLTQAWGGISGLQYRLQGTWSVAKELNISLAHLSQILSERPAMAFGLGDKKGFLRPGLDADVVVWDPDFKEIVEEQHCLHRHKLSPFHGVELKGSVVYTLLRGKLVYNRELNFSPFGTLFGRILKRSKIDGNITQMELS
ncbi:Amidohydrolase [Gracilaria domingensis]|nr:Amidohydrolase [Gracilaria domingensis]